MSTALFRIAPHVKLSPHISANSLRYERLIFLLHHGVTVRFTPAQHLQIAAVYDKCAADRMVPPPQRTAFARKADWFRMLARLGEKLKFTGPKRASASDKKCRHTEQSRNGLSGAAFICPGSKRCSHRVASPLPFLVTQRWREVSRMNSSDHCLAV